MSNRKPSEFRRSRSSSNIPQPSRNSKLPTRESNQRNLVRSLSRVGLDSRSVDRNARPSTSNASTLGSSLARPISRQHSSSSLRPSGVTPLNRAGGKSPRSSARKDVRPISDKNWQYQELVKVRNFVAERFPDLISSNIKSGISLDLFVELTHGLFKLIDNRINIMRENYIVEVAANLNRYQYPASVKPSLLKTVNTPHCWPSVLAILSWLVDFTKESNIDEVWNSDFNDLEDVAVFKSFCLWNEGAQEHEVQTHVLTPLEQDLERVFGVNEDHLVNLNQKIANLQEISIDQNLKRKNFTEAVQNLQTSTDETNAKCDNYLKKKDILEQDIVKNLAIYSEKVKDVDQELSKYSKDQENLQSVVAIQPHSHAEKLLLVEEIAALKNTLLLKEEKQEQQFALSATCDFQLQQLKQKIEAGAYKFNSIIDELELFNSDLRCTHIRDTGFADGSAQQEFEHVIGVIEKLIGHLSEGNCIMQGENSKGTKLNNQLESELLLGRKTSEELSKAEMEFDLNLKRETKILKSEIDKATESLAAVQATLEETKKTHCAILTSLQKSLEEKHKTYEYWMNFKVDFKQKAVVFFENLSRTTRQNLDAYMQQMKQITEALTDLQRKQLESKKEALQNLKKSKSASKKKQNIPC